MRCACGWIPYRIGPQPRQGIETSLQVKQGPGYVETCFVNTFENAA